MLSRRDIEKELGKGINIFPLIQENFKENSVNLTISHNAWTLGEDTTVYWYGGSNFGTKDGVTKKRTYTLKKGQSCIFKTGGNQDKAPQYVILLPHTTTLIETSEVIGVGNNIGGALHSKVGIVAKGIGHIGTMLGPGYCGHLFISLHNITDHIVALRVGTTFVSLTFDYLNTQVIRTSSTVSGHVDKFSELGIIIDESTRNFLTADWKSNITGIRNKMIESDSYKEYRAYIRKNTYKEIAKYINRRNIIVSAVVIAIFMCLLGIATYADTKVQNPIWVDRFWNVGCSGLIGSGLITLFNFFKAKK